MCGRAGGPLAKPGRAGAGQREARRLLLLLLSLLLLQSEGLELCAHGALPLRECPALEFVGKKALLELTDAGILGRGWGGTRRGRGGRAVRRKVAVLRGRAARVGVRVGHVHGGGVGRRRRERVERRVGLVVVARGRVSGAGRGKKVRRWRLWRVGCLQTIRALVELAS